MVELLKKHLWLQIAGTDRPVDTSTPKDTGLHAAAAIPGRGVLHWGGGGGWAMCGQSSLTRII